MSVKIKGALIGALLLTAVPFIDARGELFGDFTSVGACADCHEDIVEGWKTTPHAAAFETLSQQGEEKQGNPGCVGCHVVGFDADGGFIDMELTPELKGVQCECCHGPGAAHVESEAPEDIVAAPGESVCRICHTVGQDRNFDFAKKSRRVHGVQRKVGK